MPDTRPTSPFDYAAQAAVYVPRHLAKPSDPAHSGQVAALAADGARRLGGRSMVLIMGTCLLLEFVVVLMLGHLFARIQPGDHAKMMMASGFGLAIMAPAIGINYLYQRRSLKLFLIDAGHFVVGMTAVGLVFVLLD